MSFSLIVPIASNKPEYKTSIPRVFQIAEDGIMFCVKSVKGIDLSLFDHIYFIVVKQLNERYFLADMLNLQFKINNIVNAEVVVLPEETKSQPETIYETIKAKNIKGAIFVKDADCSFVGDVLQQNSIAVCPLESLNWVNPQDKSYVAVDDMFYVTNIIEKRLVSHYFSAGGYCFENVEDFVRYYDRYKRENKLYLSHIIYSMLLDKHIFRPIAIKNYQDLNTI